MGKCIDCGKETDGKCYSVTSSRSWYKCPECFDNENAEGCIVSIIVFGVIIVTIIILAVFGIIK